MKPLSEKQALLKLDELKSNFRRNIKQNYEHRAKSCATCETKGACCLDAHFVNVHITKLEAVSIARSFADFTPEKQREIQDRITETIEKYELSTEGDTFAKTYACPLFEQNVGCIIHEIKPIPCIAHACYERAEDLPPDELQKNAELKIERLNEHTYKQFTTWLPLPVWLNSLEKS